MGILDRFSQRQPPKGEPDLTTRAQLLVAELVKPLDKPNQEIINDLILLVASLNKSTNPNINSAQVLKTAQTLIHQLVDPIPQPNQHLIDELLTVVMLSASPKPKEAPATAAPTNAQQPQRQTQQAPQQTSSATQMPQQQANTAAPAPTSSTQQPQLAPQSQQSAQKPPEPSKTATTTPSQKGTDQKPSEESPDRPSARAQERLLSLLMEQIKEVVSITNTLSEKQREDAKKASNRIDVLSETIERLQQQIENVDKQLGDIQKNMDKFIGLYEVVTNQYNPFVEKEDSADATTTPQQATTTSQQPQAAPRPQATPAAGETTLDLSTIKDIKSLKRYLSAIDDTTFVNQKELLDEVAKKINNSDDLLPDSRSQAIDSLG